MGKIAKKLFNPGIYPNEVSSALLLMRLSVGVLMLSHGIGKFQNLFGSEPIQFSDPLGLGATASLAFAVFAEVFCSILLIIGLGTRFAAIPLFITMMVATFVIHINDGFDKQEFPILYAVIYFTLAIIGPGRYSLDSSISKKLNLAKKN